MSLRQITDADFEAVVLESELPVLVEFTASWCGPCRVLGPVFEQAAVVYEGKVHFVVLDTDVHVETTRKYGVLSIPTIMLFNEGEIVGSLVGMGARPRDEIDQLIARLASH